MARKRRHTTYKDWITENGLIKLEGMARDGLVNEEIANQIGIHPSTLYDWQKKHPDIAESLKEGKEVVDRQVENALYKTALEGNTTAQIFWLKNRKPNEWRDKKEVGVTVDKSLEDFFGDAE